VYPMSLSTWTLDELWSRAEVFSQSGWRIVEAQHQVSTMKVTDTVEEQNVLEQIIEQTVPAANSNRSADRRCNW
jgi:hypothetical protein